MIPGTALLAVASVMLGEMLITNKQCEETPNENLLLVLYRTCNKGVPYLGSNGMSN